MSSIHSSLNRQHQNITSLLAVLLCFQMCVLVLLPAQKTHPSNHVTYVTTTSNELELENSNSKDRTSTRQTEREKEREIERQADKGPSRVSATASMFCSHFTAHMSRSRDSRCFFSCKCNKCVFWYVPLFIIVFGPRERDSIRPFFVLEHITDTNNSFTFIYA